MATIIGATHVTKGCSPAVAVAILLTIALFEPSGIYLLCLFNASICWPPRNINNLEFEEEARSMVVVICIFSQPYFQLLLRVLNFKFFMEAKFFCCFISICCVYVMRLFLVSFVAYICCFLLLC